MEKYYLNNLISVFCSSDRFCHGLNRKILAILFFVLPFCGNSELVFAHSTLVIDTASFLNKNYNFDDGIYLYNPDDYRITEYGVDEYGVFVHFYLLVASNEGPNSKIDGTIKFRYHENGATYKGSLFKYGGDPETMRIRVEYLNESYSSGGIRFRAENGTAGNNAWSGFITGPDGVKYKTDGGAELTEVHIKWYIPNELIGRRLTILHNQLYFFAGHPVKNEETSMYFDNIKSRKTKIFNPPLPDATFTTGEISANPNKMLVKYAYNSTTAPAGVTVKHWMDGDFNNKVTDASNVKPTGPVDAFMSNYSQTHTFHSEFIGKGGYMHYTQSQQVAVPPYIWPSEIKAIQNGGNLATISWQVNLPTTGSGFVDDGGFEVSRSVDSTFADIAKIIPVKTIGYDPAKSDYEVTDDLRNLKDSTHVYYRLRRTASASDWDWDVSRNTDFLIDINDTLTTDTVILDETGPPKAIITWEPFKGIWFENTKFVIKKSNETNGAAPDIIELDEDEARFGKYIDENIPYCNEFTYSIEVTLGNGFESPPEKDVPGSVLAVDIGTVKNLAVSKGYFPDRTELRWSSVGTFDNFIVKRKIYGSSDNFVQIANVPGSTTSEVQTDDVKGTPGVYYQYMVIGAVKCNNTVKYSDDTLYAIGFRSPTGNIYGRITYENGQAVENVAVRLESQSNTQLGQSVYLNGIDKSFLKLDTLLVPFADSAFTIGAWVNPDDIAPKNQVIFSRGGQYELGFDANAQLYFEHNGTRVSGNYFNPNHSFVHIAGIYGNDSLGIMLNDSLIARIPYVFQPAVSVDSVVYIGRKAAGNNFKGYVDEMRVWNMALSQKQITRDYTRILVGNEAGLVAYWRFDETISDQFYDISQSEGKYNRNDGTMDAAFVQHTDNIPTFDQLSLKDYTDLSGNYMISGVPYTGVNGTTYRIVPLLGTHQFDPISVNRLVSSSSNSFTVDFVDKSSFPVSGYVLYRNSTVPVKGVQFQIDGRYAQKDNGEVIETDAAGKFTISVPVGTHEVKAVKVNHVFVNGGKITDRFGQNLNYQGSISERILRDSTSIRFIGRVAGGAVQAAYLLGQSLSKNNLGKELSINMKLPSGSKYEINSGNADSVVWIDHLLPSNQSDSSKIHRTRVEYKANAIVIHPDSLTGEFIVDLIPEKFIIDNVNATGWGNLLDEGSLLLDFSNKFITKYSVNVFQDSTQSASGEWTYKTYTDTVAYNTAYPFIQRITPSVKIVQLDNSGEELPYFGDTVYTYRSFDGTTLDIPVIDNEKSGKGIYLFEKPVFKQNKQYHFELSAFEQYPFYESVKPDGTKVIAQVDGEDVIDRVPTQDGHVSLYNSIRNGSTVADTVSLNAEGKAVYHFTAGDPDLAANGIKNFSANVKFGQATNVNWEWFGDPQMQVYVMGGKLSGTDFVTAGPNKLLMVLRDPPGSKSYTYTQSGSSISTSNTYSGTFSNVGDEEFVQILGSEVITFTGIGAGTINASITNNGIGLGIHHEEHYTHTNTKTENTTLTTTFQTGSDPTFVGAAGDLYVGYSTNITYGESNNISIISRDELKATDRTIYESDTASAYLIVERSGLNFGEKFGTLFAYPQQHIEKVLIPNLINIRNTLLLPPSTSPATAQSSANTNKSAVYVSKLSDDNPNFGKSNDNEAAFGAAATFQTSAEGPSYTIYFPESSLYRTDTIMTLNQYVDKWIERMADNEREKLNSTLLQNYSFHAGTPIQYSETVTHDTTIVNSFKIVVSGSVVNSAEVKIFGTGFTFKFKESIGTVQGGEFGGGTSSQITQGFVLSSGGVDDYLSVDVNKAGDNSFVFRTKGGATACPYEGGTKTKYYQPGTLLDQPTARIEVPSLSVNQPVVNDVPSSRKAVYTLSLRNESEAKLPATFVLTYANTDSIKGAYIAVDGSSIGGGRSFVVQYGQTVAKVLTLSKGPDAMDYNNIPIILHSSCQYDPVGYQELIADTVLISAHFIPSCSDIHIKSPADQWVLNTLSLKTQGERYLPITIDEFDVTNSLFDHIKLQYKSSASSEWITAMTFYADSTKFNEAEGEKAFISNAQGIKYNLVMDDASFNDQAYDIRAVSYCKLGPNDFVTTSSNVISGLKDTYAPRLFGSAQPANGVLGIEDEIRLNFNEEVSAGLLTNFNFRVTGIKNGALSDHSVSVQLDGQNDFMATEFDKNLAGKDITVEMWVLPEGQVDQTIFSQGNINNSMEMAFTADNHLKLIIGDKIVKSEDILEIDPGNWAHVALVYHAETGEVSAFYNFEEVIHDAVVGSYTGIGHFEFGRSIAQNGNFYAGKMHGARIWTDALSGTQLQINSLKRLSGGENGLLGYYPMTEGKGTLVFDKAHGSNAVLTGNWSLPPGKSIVFGGNGYVKASTDMSPITADMDFTIELWFKGLPGQSNAALVSNGKGDGTDPGGSENLFFLGFENGLLTFKNNGSATQAEGNYLDNNWHHVALAVNRNAGIAQFFVDGELKEYFDSKNLGGLASPYMYLGARQWYSPQDANIPYFDWYFNGKLDGFRLWNTYLNQTLIQSNNNIRLKGDEMGLMAYYPFEEYVSNQNNQELAYTLDDMKIQDDPNVDVPEAVDMNATESNDKAPIKDRGPVENLDFDFVVNNDALIINLLAPRQDIDKTIVTLQAENIRDINGNAIVSPITWTAYIDRNQLKWGDVELNLSKKLYVPMQFESYLLNSGGTVQNFTLDGLPTWLRASPASGTIDPKGRQKITFTVDEGLNVGSYDEIVYMRNDNDESEALAINLKVSGEEPGWAVNPADFDYSMTVYGKMRINNIFSADADDMLAVFREGECVGVAHNSYNAENDFWYVFLTVYSNLVTADQLEFRMWDAGTGKIYFASPSQLVTFANNAIVGSADAPILFSGEETLFQNINLSKGWNWISFNLASPALSSVDATLAKGNWESDDRVKNEEMGFDEYSADHGWVGTLGNFNNTALFMLNTARAQVLSVKGTLVDIANTPIMVKGNRWSYISYLPQVNQPVEEALAGYDAVAEDVIKSQTAFAMYDPDLGWVGNLDYLEPGKGYMLYRNTSTDVTFVYPSSAGGLSAVSHIAMKSTELNRFETPVPSNFSFADNMTALATVGGDFELRPGDRLHAYVNGQLRGKAIQMDNSVIKEPSFFLNISGREEGLVTFKLERMGQIVASARPTITFRSNGRLGSLANPFMIDFQDVSDRIVLYPNPFAERITIDLKQAISGKSRQIQLRVYDISGKLIFEGSKERVNTDHYRVTWEGRNDQGGECNSGLYFINISIDGVPHVYKAIKR